VDVIVSSPGVELPPVVKAAATEKVQKLARYLDGMDRAEVHLYEERNPRIADKKDVCEVTVEGHGHHVRTKVAAPDPFSAVDAAAHKLEQQLHKLKNKLVGRSHPKSRTNGHAVLDGAAVNGSVPTVAPIDADTDDESDVLDAIVRSKTFASKPMTIEEALLQLDLLGHDFYLFTNASTQRANVLYRRRAGGVGLIEQE